MTNPNNNPQNPDSNSKSNYNSNKKRIVKPVIQLKRKMSSSEKSWEEYVLQLQQSAPEHIENAAKFLGALVSVCFTLLARTHQDIFIKMGAQQSLGALEIAPLLLWFFCIGFCFLVFFPFDYEYDKGSVETIEEAHRKIVKNKRDYLKVATVLFFLGVGALLAGMIW